MPLPRKTITAVLSATLAAQLFLPLPSLSADARYQEPVLIAVDGDAEEAKRRLEASGLDGDTITVLEEIDTLVVEPGKAAEALNTLAGEVRWVETDAEARTMAVTPDDPFHDQNWGMQTSGVDEVWANETGDSSVVIAIIDTGVTEVADLTGRLTAGYDFVNDDADPTDDEGHGTQSAMVAAAAGNNAEGANGACWGCRIMPVKVLGANGSGSYSDVAEGIIWAAENGADIINLSLGGPSPSNALTEAVNHARSLGVLVIAAAGNDGLNQVSYPGATPGVFGVAANTSSGYRYSWSNYHATDADLSAPGCLIAQDPLDSGWYWFCGTSAASPLVAGTAGLLLSEAPWADASAIERALRIGGWHLPWVTRFTADGTLDATSSRTALLTLDTTPPTISVTSAPSEPVRGTISVTVTTNDDRGVQRVEALSGGKILTAVTAPAGTTRILGPSTLNVSSYLVTANTLTLRAVDLAGNTTSTSVTITPDNTPPTLVISTPASSPLRGNATITVSTTDSGSGVAATELWRSGAKITTTTTSPWGLALDTTTIADGTHTLEVRSIDRAGNTTVRTRAYRIDNTAPQLAVTWPQTEWLRGRVEIPYTVSDATSGVALVELLAGEVVIARSNPLTQKIYWNSYLTNGEVTLTVRATDRAGNTTTTSRVLKADNTLPTVSSNVAWRLQGNVTLAAVPADNTLVSSVQWWLQSAPGVSTPVLLGTGTGENWSLPWNTTTLPNGQARIRIDVRDAAGNLRSVIVRTSIAN